MKIAKNIKNLIAASFFAATLFACGGSPQTAEDTLVQEEEAEAETTTPAEGAAPQYNMLTAEEEAEGWTLLFDGESVDQWKGAFQEGDNFPEQGWMVDNGLLIVQESGGGESKNGGDIVTRELYDNFELKVDFKLTPGANSGIKYYVDPAQEPNPGSAIGLEYQLLDDDLHPDAKKGRDGNRTIGSLYDLKTASADKPVNPVGEWNTAHIIADNNKIEHWLNGEKVLEYERGSQEYKDLVAISKYKVHDNFGMVNKGHILLQDHGNTVMFRNIKVRKL